MSTGRTMSGFTGALKLEWTSVSSKSSTKVFFCVSTGGLSNALLWKELGESCWGWFVDGIWGVYLRVWLEMVTTVGLSSPCLTWVIRAVCWRSLPTPICFVNTIHTYYESLYASSYTHPSPLPRPRLHFHSASTPYSPTTPSGLSAESPSSSVYP